MRELCCLQCPPYHPACSSRPTPTEPHPGSPPRPLETAGPSSFVWAVRTGCLELDTQFLYFTYSDSCCFFVVPARLAFPTPPPPIDFSFSGPQPRMSHGKHRRAFIKMCRLDLRVGWAPKGRSGPLGSTPNSALFLVSRDPL